jgi:menaquinol-cytochrome c reductase iron-sulfur subunit
MSNLHSSTPAGARDRRGFLGSAIALLCGAVAMVVPAAVGVAAFLNPLRQKGQGGGFVRLTSLDAVPQDGTPLKVPVIADRSDAWTHFAAEPVGAVFLRREGDKVLAFQVSCPHAGCAIGFEASPKGGRFYCPCHSAAFDLVGKRTDAVSPSPRDMDSLEVEIRDKNDVWVKFQTFLAGTAGKTAQG